MQHAMQKTAMQLVYFDSKFPSFQNNTFYQISSYQNLKVSNNGCLQLLLLS